jgi:ABC-type transporter Mla subunit MlaD
MASDDGSDRLTSDTAERVSRDLEDAARLVNQLPDDDANKVALRRRLIAITASAKHDLARVRPRLDQFLEDLRRR